jgi:hypothetical protein
MWRGITPRGPPEVDRTLVAQSRSELIGNPIGMVAFAALAWATTLSIAIVTAGTIMAALALEVARWPETGFVRATVGRVLRSAGAKVAPRWVEA